MACYRMYADSTGETHLAPLELPVRETYAGTVAGLSEIPATTTGMGRFIGRKPDVGLHPAPRRQFLVVLEGTLEIVTSGGEEQRLHPGDVLFADDVGSKGHHSRDVGDEPLMMMSVGVQDEWDVS